MEEKKELMTRELQYRNNCNLCNINSAIMIEFYIHLCIIEPLQIYGGVLVLIGVHHVYI